MLEGRSGMLLGTMHTFILAFVVSIIIGIVAVIMAKSVMASTSEEENLFLFIVIGTVLINR